MAKIKSIKAREILDSRGNPTVEVDVILDSGLKARASVPSGASKGEYEAKELRDEDKHRFSGRGVLKAIKNIREIIFPHLKGKKPDYEKIDRLLIQLDGTEDKSHLGANAILAVSLAVAKVAALSCNQPLYKYLAKGKKKILPVPFLNILNGGVHADNNLDIQEFMIIPLKMKRFSEALRAASEVFHRLKTILKQKGLCVSVGDEGGFAPNLCRNREAIEFILRAIKEAGYRPDKEISLGLDIAATAFYKDGYYQLEKKKKNSLQMITFYQNLLKKYPIISIEDALAEEDWEGWRLLTGKLSGVQLVGDDLFVTNPKRLIRGIKEGVANSILIKLNQIGTLSETLETIQLAKDNKYRAIISHRSGETEDTFISHLAVATEVGQIKTGSVSRSERVAKYNELLRIEEELGRKAIYAGEYYSY